MSKTHELKTWPEYYRKVVIRKKNFEVRRNDRDFVVGDVLMLREFDPDKQEYTGEHHYRIVSYILDDPQYVKEGYVILSLA